MADFHSAGTGSNPVGDLEVEMNKKERPVETRLSARDAKRFLEMLESNTEPNEALEKAFERYKEMIERRPSSIGRAPLL